MNWDEIFNIVQLSKMVYHDNADKLLAKGDCKVDFFSNTDTHFFVMTDKDFIYVVFRGTTSIQNWMTNIDINLAKAHLFFGRVYTGFLAGYLLLCKKLFATLSVHLILANAPVRLFFCGHYLGGAIAHLLVADLLAVNGKDLAGFEAWFKTGLHLVGVTYLKIYVCTKKV